MSLLVASPRLPPRHFQYMKKGPEARTPGPDSLHVASRIQSTARRPGTKEEPGNKPGSLRLLNFYPHPAYRAAAGARKSPEQQVPGPRVKADGHASTILPWKVGGMKTEDLEGRKREDGRRKKTIHPPSSVFRPPTFQVTVPAGVCGFRTASARG